jgi:hypothetical protein
VVGGAKVAVPAAVPVPALATDHGQGSH